MFEISRSYLFPTCYVRKRNIEIKFRRKPNFRQSDLSIAIARKVINSMPMGVIVTVRYFLIILNSSKQ